jgi:DNA-binding NarL/FixJ family response regulator
VSDKDVLEAVRAGVAGIVLKDLAPKHLVPCIRKVANGHMWLELSSVGRLLENLVGAQAGYEV